MAKKRSKKSSNELIIKLIIAALFLLLSYFGYQCNQIGFENTINNAISSLNNQNGIQIEKKNVDGIIEVHTIDVGQADSILVMQGEQVMLIDCGTRAKGSIVVEYLKKLGITKIDVLVGTHTHDDHMGGIAEVIRNFEIGSLYAPDNSNDGITAFWYLDFLDAVLEKNVNWIYPKVGDTFKIGDADVQVLAPNSEKYNDLNNYSIVLRATYGEKGFIFMGDAETLSEKEILENKLNLDADVIKLGHHGSSTSSSAKFLKAVNPGYAIISCGKGNTYHHPIKSVMDRLKGLGIIVYRTDESGTIIISSNGYDLNFNVEPGDYKCGDEL